MRSVGAFEVNFYHKCLFQPGGSHTACWSFLFRNAYSARGKSGGPCSLMDRIPPSKRGGSGPIPDGGTCFKTPASNTRYVLSNCESYLYLTTFTDEDYIAF